MIRGQGAASAYAEFTVDRYNRAVGELVRATAFELGALAAASAVVLLVPIRGEVGSPLRYIWIIFMPLVLIGLAGKARLPFAIKRVDPGKSSGKRVEDRLVHVVVSSGSNISAVLNTVGSIQHWHREVRRRYDLVMNYEIEVVTEEWAAQRFRRALPSGVRLVVVPQHFRTRNGASYKARALEYARLNRRLDDARRTWIYHHDDETAIGEDTVLGIADFISSNRGDVGVNLIVYPLAWKGGIVGHLETIRSALDAANASISPKTLKHGSGFLVRASVEDSIGWDFRDSLAEDFIFHSRASKVARYALIGGFAYELSPPGLSDMLKQRRRWFSGKLEAYLNGSVDLSSSLKELIELMENVAFLPVNVIAGVVGAHYLGIMEPPALLLVSLISAYYMLVLIWDSFIIHMHYLGFGPLDFIPHAFYAVVGMIIESLAPWYAFMSRNGGYFVMRKSVPINLGFRY